VNILDYLIHSHEKICRVYIFAKQPALGHWRQTSAADHRSLTMEDDLRLGSDSVVLSLQINSLQLMLAARSALLIISLPF
jgi:hypothetical protein